MECGFDSDKSDSLQWNSYIIERFSIEARLTINKNPHNLNPQLEGHLVFGKWVVNIGGVMDESDHNLAMQSRFAAEIEQKQISIILRLLEYTGLYNTFKAGVLTPYESRRLDE